MAAKRTVSPITRQQR
jgi:hypothetical protein